MRLWEFLGAGTIPVVLSDHYEFPSLKSAGLDNNDSWQEAVIDFPQIIIGSLDQQLHRNTAKQLKNMQEIGLRLFGASLLTCCFLDALSWQDQGTTHLPASTQESAAPALIKIESTCQKSSISYLASQLNST